jgi:hypothetical protein
MSKRQQKQILPKEILEYLEKIKITKCKVDTRDRIKSIIRHFKNGNIRYARVQLKSLSKQAEKLHQEAEYINYLSYIISRLNKDDTDIPF